MTASKNTSETIAANDFTHNDAAGDRQRADNIFRLTPHSEAASYSHPLTSGGVTFLISNYVAIAPETVAFMSFLFFLLHRSWKHQIADLFNWY